VLVYNSETYGTFKQMKENRLRVFAIPCMRKTAALTLMDRIWNEKVYSRVGLYQLADTAVTVAVRRSCTKKLASSTIQHQKLGLCGYVHGV